MRYPQSVRTTACREFSQLQLSRRKALQAGALALTGLGLPDLPAGQAGRLELRPEWVWSGERRVS